MTNNESNITVAAPVKSKAMAWYEVSSMEQAMVLAEKTAGSSLAPPHFKGKPNDIFLAITFGASLGLNPLQSIQNISVINNKPAIWGDAVNALVTAHPDFVSHDFQWGAEKMEWTITLVRLKHGKEISVTMTYSWQDAVTAKHSAKDTYKNNPKDMLRRRCYGKVAQVQFPDVLSGIALAEEEEDYAYVKSRNKSTSDLSDAEISMAEKMGIKPKDVIIEGEIIPEEAAQPGSPSDAEASNLPPQSENEAAPNQPEDESRKADQVLYLEELYAKYEASEIKDKKDLKAIWLTSASVSRFSEMPSTHIMACIKRLEIILKNQGVL